MRLRSALGFILTLAGWTLLVLTVIVLVLGLYYRPTFEYVAVDGRSRPMPAWVTSQWVSVVLAATFGIVGGLCVRAGRLWHRL